MAIYVLGGSSTIMSGGWPDSFIARMARREPVRNLAVGAGNTLTAYYRLTEEVALQPGDTVVCASTITDVVCLSRGGYADGAVLRYTEELIRHVRAAGARFVPVLLDTVLRAMDLLHASFKDELLSLFRHYAIDWIDVTQAFAQETGLRRVPAAFYDATGHLQAGSEMTLFIADLVTDAVRGQGGYPRDARPLFVDPARPPLVATDFAPEPQARDFSNAVLATKLWAPEVVLAPGSRPEGPLHLEALFVMADPEGGAFGLSTPQSHITVSAQPVVDYYRGPMFLCAYIPNLIGAPLEVAPGAPLQVTWDTHGQGIRSDVFFEPNPKPGPSRSGLAAMMFRHAA